MPCFNPLKGFRSRTPGKSGKYGIVFKPADGFVDQPVEVPCGQCRGCRLERSRQWAVRCVHEAYMHDDNCFVTLTYDDKHVPKNYSLEVGVFQEFIKALRNKFGSGIRYYHCGEYGQKSSRPHYHALLFNFDFKDKKLHGVSNGHRLYTSDTCNSLWNNRGFCILGDVTFESAAYVARYVMKKMTGKALSEGFYGDLKPEYATMSRRPGIGKAFFDKFQSEMYRDDFIVLGGRKLKIPRYYDGQREISDPDSLFRVKISRSVNFEKHSDNNTYDRLRVREEIQSRKENLLIRSIK